MDEEGYLIDEDGNYIVGEGIYINYRWIIYLNELKSYRFSQD